MSGVKRRSFLAGTAAVGVAMMAPRTAEAATGIPLTREVHRVVVIGSGFGGGVTALRLAEAGVPVTLLERGIRWQTGPNAETFPHPASPDKRILWHQSNPTLFGRPAIFEPYTGLLETVTDENMTAICAAGVAADRLCTKG